MVQEGHRLIELPLGLFRAGDGKVNRAQDVAGVLLHPAFWSARAARKRDDHQTDTEVMEGITRCTVRRPARFLPGKCAPRHAGFSRLCTAAHPESVTALRRAG